MLTKVAVIGQGYVGLPLAISIAECGFNVVGIELDEKKIQSINTGISIIEDVSDSRIIDQIKQKRFYSTQNFEEVANSEIVIICVPTPLDEKFKPDLSYVFSSVSELSKYLQPGTLVVLESTVEPRTTRSVILPLLVRESGLQPNQFDLAFSPERIDPTNKIWNLHTTPKLVAGITERATKRTSKFYSNFVETIIECENPEIAETAKLLENSFRLINISFINEISIFCNKIGIDVNKVVSAAATKPYGFMAFYPSIGVGGHCIPVDPLYLANTAKAVGASTRFIDLADQINQEMPEYFVNRAEEKIGGLKDKKVLVVGVSYKPNVADVRESPVEGLIAGLKQKGAQVSWHDDLVKEWNSEISVTLSDDFDLAILATPHAYLDLTKLGNVPILDTRGSI